MTHSLYEQLSKDIAHFVQNSLQIDHWQWVLGLAACVVAFGLFVVIRFFFSLSRNCPYAGDEFSIRHLMIRAFSYPVSCYISGAVFYVGFSPIVYSYTPDLLNYWTMCMILFTAYIAITLTNRIVLNAMVYFEKKATLQTPNHHMLITIVGRATRIVAIILILLITGDNLGLNVTALIAGAGVLGLAFAFASQDMIANIFGTIIVVGDTPFNVGDYIQIDGTEGEVISIGFRSTRLKMKSGFQVIVPNKTAANAVITNISRRPYVRHEIKLGLVYNTTPEQMHHAVEILKEIISKTKGQHHDLPVKVGFSSFDAYALTITVTAWFHNLNEEGQPIEVNYWDYAAWASDINFQILERFNAEKLSFAYPTNVTYMIQEGK